MLEPVSVENLHNNRSTRNFWCNVENAGCWSITGVSAEAEHEKFTKEQDKSVLTAGFMWQSIKRTSAKYQMEAEVTSFVPVCDNVEIMYVRLCNMAKVPQKITPVAAVPIYGRSADNIRDHRNVTSMLHRIHTTKHGVLVKPTMSFDEKGHRRNHQIYFVEGITGNKTAPVSFYPTVDTFIGEVCTYFSSLTAYGLYAYDFKMKKAAFTFIMAILVMPTQVTAMGFLRLITKMGMYDFLLPLIIPSIASPSVFYFMYSYLQSSLPLALVEASRIDGCGEFRTFNQIVLPILIATLRGADYMNFDSAKIYMMITVAIVPIIIVYLLLSKYIIAGITLGGVKE